MMFVRQLLSMVVLSVSFSLASAAQAVVLVPTQIYQETFNTPTADLAATEVAYPALSGIGDVKVSGGAAEIIRGGDNYLGTDQVFNEEIWVSGDLSMTAGVGGTTAQSLVIGNLAFHFFVDNGAFRISEFNPVTGVLGSQLTPGNIPLGFVPAMNVMHHIMVHSNNLGAFDVTVEDGTNVASDFNQSFLFGSFVPGGVGFTALYGSTTSRYDNLTVVAMRELPPVPEPSCIVLLGLGAVVLGSVRRKRVGR